MPTELIHVPFAKGQHEGVDPELMPQGLLREAVNVRFRADGRLGCRYGYSDVGVDVLGDSDVAPHDIASFGEQRLLFASGDRTLVRVETGATWKALDDTLAAARSSRVLGDVEAIARPPLQNESKAADVAVTASGWALVVWTTPRPSGALDATAMVVRVDDGVVLCIARLAVAKAAEAVRAVAVGSVVYALLVDNTTGDLEAYSLDTASAQAFTARGALVDTLALDSSLVFDVRQNGSAEFVVAWRSSGTQISWENFTAATLATVGSRQTVTANGKLSVAAVNGVVIAVANLTSTGTVECRTWNEGTQALINTTTVDSNTDNVGQPWVELDAAGTSAMLSWGATQTGTNATHPAWRYRTLNPSSHALGTLVTTVGARPASGNFFLPSGDSAVWLVDTDTIERGYVLTRFGTRSPEPEGLIAKPIAATFALVGERRSHVPALGSGEYAWAALIVNGDTSAVALDALPVLYRFEAEQRQRIHVARMGGNLYLAGGLVTSYDGCRYYEHDFGFTPVFDELTPQAAAGELTSDSVYTYAAVLEFVSAQNERLFSAVSTPRNVTLGPSHNTVRLEFHAPFTRKLDAAMASTNVNLIVYRSKTDGTVLRELARLKWSRGTTVLSYTDLADDCDLDGKPIIYTQGNRGALSGLLQNDAPNGATYIWPGRDRIVLGRVDGTVQWSKRLFNGEAIAWSNQSGFFQTIPGLTAVASLDERWILFTEDAIWEVTGEGPDDAGQGEFSSPRKLPSEGGCIDARSLVEVSAGLIYQQDDDRLFLLPRGGGAPVWFGQPVRDTLADFPLVTSAVYCRRDNTVCFTCNDVTSTSGVIVVHDLRSGDWYVDELDDLPPLLGSASWSGAHAICGSTFVREQSLAYADLAATIPMRVRTGTILPFGINAWGWVYSVALLGEWESQCTVTLRVRFGDGDFVDIDTFTLASADYSQGDRVVLSWMLPRSRTGRIELEFLVEATTPGAALSLNAFTLEVEAAPGLPRLSEEVRA